MCNVSCPDKPTEHSNLLKVLLLYDYNMDREGGLRCKREIQDCKGKRSTRKGLGKKG